VLERTRKNTQIVAGESMWCRRVFYQNGNMLSSLLTLGRVHRDHFHRLCRTVDRAESAQVYNFCRWAR
jgi:hypothetical protein